MDDNTLGMNYHIHMKVAEYSMLLIYVSASTILHFRNHTRNLSLFFFFSEDLRKCLVWNGKAIKEVKAFL